MISLLKCCETRTNPNGVLFALIMVVLVACDQSQPKLNDHSTPTATLPTKPSSAQPSTSQSIPSEPAKPLSPLEELIKTAKTAKGHEAYFVIQEVAMHRTDEACALLIKFLREESALIKDKLPTPDEFKRGKEEYERTGKIPASLEELASWGEHAGRSVYTAKQLVMLDMPEARQAAYEFRDQLAKKWAGSELGKKELNTLDTNLRFAEADVKSGAVPWKMQK